MKQCLLDIKQLFKKEIKILCFVGIGGIKKTSLVKAIFDNINDTYNVSCFVESI